MVRTFLTGILITVLTALAFAADASSPPSKVVAYYFHGTMRCPTCQKLEQYSKEAIQSNFKDELAAGRLEFKAVNVEDRGNEHYIKEYGLFTKSLVLSKIKNGKETESKNLDKIWEYVGNKQKFSEYVTQSIQEFMKGM